MSPAIASSLGIVIYLALFATVGIVFLFVNLLVGKFVRPHDPHADKLEIYECGEPTIGSSFVQFDLRFYVVALLFIIFDVEVAFFFPWAAVFGKSTNMADMARDPAVVRATQRGKGSLVALPRRRQGRRQPCHLPLQRARAGRGRPRPRRPLRPGPRPTGHGAPPLH